MSIFLLLGLNADAFDRIIIPFFDFSSITIEVEYPPGATSQFPDTKLITPFKVADVSVISVAASVVSVGS